MIFKLDFDCTVGHLETVTNLRHPHIQQHHPVLKRLQRKSAKNEHNAKRSQPPFRQLVSVILDHRNNRATESSHNPDHKSNANREPPDVVDVLHQSAAKQRRHRVAHGSQQDSPSLSSRDPRPASRGIVERRTHAARISKDLSHGKQRRKGSGKFQTQTRIEGSAESNASYRAKKSFPPSRIVIQPAGRSIQFNRKRDSSCHT